MRNETGTAAEGNANANANGNANANANADGNAANAGNAGNAANAAGISVKVVENAAELEGAIAVRMRVFVGEQGIPAAVEMDDADTAADTVHAVALHQGTVIGTGRLLGDVDGKGPHIGRMAVAREWRRSGVGGMVLSYLEGQARARGFARITLHAQEYVKAFYAVYGYREVGEMFLEVEIPHREMVKEL